jgi:hypothetical protein
MKNILILPLLLSAFFCSAQSRIVGKPFKIDNYEIAQFDFPNEMNWDDANKACKSLGKGWRLPTKNELRDLYKLRKRIGGFKGRIYWSGQKISMWSAEQKTNKVWVKMFDRDDEYFGKDLISRTVNKNSVRALRSF